jgi:hypothetical protein
MYLGFQADADFILQQNEIRIGSSFSLWLI